MGRQTCNDVGKSLALNHDVIPNALCGQIAVAGKNGLNDVFVFLQGLGDTVAGAQLDTSERREAAVQRPRLFGQERIVARAIDRCVKRGILFVIGFMVSRRRGGDARPVRRQQRFLVLGCDAPGGEPGAGRLEFRHRLEHFDKTLQVGGADNRSPAGPDIHETDGLELEQRFPDRRSREAELFGERDLVKAGAGCQLPGENLIFKVLAEFRSGLHRDNAPRPSNGRLLLEFVSGHQIPLLRSIFGDRELSALPCGVGRGDSSCIHKC